MSTEKMFEKAARLQVRFDSVQGPLNVEDLFTLPLTSGSSNRATLDNIGRALKKKIKESGESESLVDDTIKVDEVLVLKFDIVLYIISVLKEERTVALAKAKMREQKQEILALIADAEKAEMKGKSKDELLALLAALGETGE